MPAEASRTGGRSARRVLGLVGVAVSAVVALAGCGGANAGEPVEKYLRGLASGDGAAACAQFSGAYKREFVASYIEGLPELGAATCEDVIANVSALLGADEVGLLRDAETTAQAEGDQATVTITGGTNTATVERIGGQWLIVGGLNYQDPT